VGLLSIVGPVLHSEFNPSEQFVFLKKMKVNAIPLAGLRWVMRECNLENKLTLKGISLLGSLRKLFPTVPFQGYT
jgi:hypothetical protein